MGTAGYDRLRITGIAEFYSVTSFTMSQTIGEHAQACICGVLTEEGAERLAGNLSGEVVTVTDQDADNTQPIFEGIIDTVKFSTENGLDVAEVRLKAGSLLLDLEQKSKSYQDVSLTYEEVISDVLQEFR